MMPGNANPYHFIGLTLLLIVVAAMYQLLTSLGIAVPPVWLLAVEAGLILAACVVAVRRAHR